jgi:hypothetical protein
MTFSVNFSSPAGPAYDLFSSPTSIFSCPRLEATVSVEPWNSINKMCYKTQMPPYEANFRGGYHCQNPRSRFQNLWLKYKGLVTSNMHMKYKSPITYHSKNIAKVKVFKKWVKLQGQGHKVKHYGTIRKSLS